MLPYSFAHLSPGSLQCNPHMLAVERLRFAAAGMNPQMAPYQLPGGYGGVLDPNLYRGGPFDPRGRFIQEEPKPQHSYIGLIAMAILSSPDQKLVLSDIYQWILDNYPYFRTRGPGWRNSIRHNLSLNDCFVKAGRSANGKGHYWAIHPANVEDFKKGDFRRRRAQRKARKAMGFSVPDEEEDDDDSPPLSPNNRGLIQPTPLPGTCLPPTLSLGTGPCTPHEALATGLNLSINPDLRARPMVPNGGPPPAKKRLFDMESLLAPEPKLEAPEKQSPNGSEPDCSTFSGGPKLSPGGHYPFSPGSMSQGLPWAHPLSLAIYSTAAGGTGWRHPFINSQGFGPDKFLGVGAGATPKSPPGSPNSAARWQETFAKIMARSYQGRQLQLRLPTEPHLIGAALHKAAEGEEVETQADESQLRIKDELQSHSGSDCSLNEDA